MCTSRNENSGTLTLLKINQLVKMVYKFVFREMPDELECSHSYCIQKTKTINLRLKSEGESAHRKSA